MTGVTPRRLEEVFADQADRMARELVKSRRLHQREQRDDGEHGEWRYDFGEIVSECYEQLVTEATRTKNVRTVFTGARVELRAGVARYIPGTPRKVVVIDAEFFRIVSRTLKNRVWTKVMEQRGYRRKVVDGRERMVPAFDTLPE